MHRFTHVAARSALAVAALSTLSCRDAGDPWRHDPGAPSLAITAGSHPGLDQFIGSLNETGTTLAKGFDPANPRLGSTLVVTFMWVGSTNTITAVHDRLIDMTPVGNTYHLVEYVTQDGISMATYVATNIQNFPSPNTQADKSDILVVEADLSEPTIDGGIVLSTYTGVDPDFVAALGEHRSAGGSAATTTTVGPGPIAADQGSLVYGVSVSDGVVGVDEGAGWRSINVLSDNVLKADAAYSVAVDSGLAEPQWTWHFAEPSRWLATTLALKPAPGQTLVLNGSLSETGSQLGQWFYPTNPNTGDAIIATFMWRGSTNVITSVSDRLSDGTPVGNEYQLVEYVTRGGVSMATYVATNVQGFPYPNTGSDDLLKVEANLSEAVDDGGVLLSAYSGVMTSPVEALGEHRSAADTGSSITTADPGEIAVRPGALVYAVTLANGVVGLEEPSDMTNITTMSDAFLKTSGAYAVRAETDSSAARPQWTWSFDAPSVWLATVLSLNPR